MKARMSPTTRTRFCLLIVPPTLMVLSACSSGQHQTNSSLNDQRLAVCPSTPNCVSSLAESGNRQVAPLTYRDDATQANGRLLKILTSMPRSSIRYADAAYIHVEFRSAFFGFIDDVEFQFAASGLIHVRSASRVGYSDFGVNRRRIEEIRTLFSPAASSGG